MHYDKLILLNITIIYFNLFPLEFTQYANIRSYGAQMSIERRHLTRATHKETCDAFKCEAFQNFSHPISILNSSN